jgi:RHS repeat-associated protein
MESNLHQKCIGAAGLCGLYVSIVAVFLYVSCAFAAADKSGVSPNSISLPNGPGSIEGLGESFQPQLNSGTAGYNVPLRVPPGTRGHAPVLQLTYEGGSGNGPVGFGWNLPMQYVQRQTDNGIPRYVDDLQNGLDDDRDGQVDEPDEVDQFINEMKEELVPQADGYYFCKNEGPFIRYRRNGQHWEGTLPDGTRLAFGVTSNSRIEDPATGRIFCWLLEKQTDTRGNTIVYNYRTFPGTENTRQKYCLSIAYGPGAPPWANFHFVMFDYEDRSDWFEDCRPAFVVRTGKRLKEVIIGTQGPQLSGHLAGDFNQDGKNDYLVRKYRLDYLNYAGTNSHWSLLAQIRSIGTDGIGSLPPAHFGYTVCHPPESVSAEGKLIGGISEPLAVMDNPLVDLVDLNGDGLPDILKTERFGGAHIGYLNAGERTTNGTRLIQWNPPQEVGSSDGFAWNVNLEAVDNVAHLSDMDGDGLADLVYKSAVGDVFFFLNEAKSRWGLRRPMSVQDEAPPSPFGSPDVRSADIDFDKRMDIIQSVSAGASQDYRIWFNLGDQKYSRSITVPQSSGFSFSLKGVHIADFNGDRVPDIARLGPDGVKITAGLGHGNFADPINVALPDMTLESAQIDRSKLQDITGDGLADLVIDRAAPGQLWYWINLGNYSWAPRKIIVGLPPQAPNTVPRWADLNANGTTDLIYADSLSEPRLLMLDVGELIGCFPRPHTLTRIENAIGRVTTINYEPSTKFAQEDAAQGNPWPDPLPFPVMVVAAVITEDSLGHAYTNKYRYHDGYYDGVEKEFRGFSRAEQMEIGDSTAPTLVTRSHFDTGKSFEAMKGKLLRLTAEEEDGDVFWDQITSWTTPPKTLMTGVNGQAVTYVHPSSQVKTIQELGQGVERRLESEFAYDLYGNETTNTDYGIVVAGDRSAFDDERITVTQYALNLSNWILRLPARQVRMDEHGIVASRAESFYDDEIFSGNNWGSVGAGNLTLRREWIDPSNPTNFVNSARTRYDSYGNPTVLLDPLGTAPGGAVDFGAGHVREVVYDSNFHAFPVREIIYVGNGADPLSVQVEYDFGFASITSSRDFNLKETTYRYDIFGRLENIVRPYDTEQYPTFEFHYILGLPVGSNGLVNYVETRQLDKPATQIASSKIERYFVSRQFLDGLGRALMTRTEAEPETPGGLPRVVVKQAVQFNARANITTTLNPFYSLVSSTTLDSLLAFEDIAAPAWQGAFHDRGQMRALNLAGAHKSQTRYDATLRAIRVTNQDGTFSRTTYEPLVTRHYDENDNDAASSHFDTPTIYFQDGLGRQIRTDETARLNDDGTASGNLQTWTTQFQYDLNGKLTRVTDSQNNLKLMTNDALGRVIFLNDPDRGLVTHFYDAASNLIETRDAKSQRITYTHDGANRILTEDYHDNRPAPPWRGTNAFADVVYRYDAAIPNLDLGDGTASTPRNTKGFLAHVFDLSGEEHTSFDDRGRAEYVLKRVADPVHQQLVPYTTRFSYDSADRVRRLVYPDNDELTYEYNDRLLLQRIPGGPSGTMISNIAYLPTGQKQLLAYGNRVRTSYHYDSRLRLTELSTVNPQLSTELIHFTYDFDSANNLTNIQDRRPGSEVPAGDPRRNTQLFQYDNLYRLMRVQYSFNLPGESIRNDGEITYRYDRIGNMLAQTSTLDHQENGVPIAHLGTMESGGTLGRFNRVGRAATDPPGPHALSSILNSPSSPRLYPYDPNGNMTDIDGLQCTWDFKDRLIAVESEKMRADYTYDYTDRRIMKRVTAKQPTTDTAPRNTIYVNKLFEVREHDQPTKYVWDGETRVARVIGSLSPSPRTQRIRVFPGWNLISVAVSSTNTLGQLKKNSMIDRVYRWNPQTMDYSSLTDSQDLPGGTVLWLKVPAQATLFLTGSYTDPANVPISTGAGYYACAGLEVLTLTNSIPADVLSWLFEREARSWEMFLPDGHRLRVGTPPRDFLAPGEALFIHANLPTELQAPEPALRLRFYHQDHLGSSSDLTDINGRLVEETGFYPFGRARTEHYLRTSPENYQFTQKETDSESGLQDFAARYLDPRMARFLTPDPLYTRSANFSLSNPQFFHIYGYALNNPLGFKDPTGQQAVNVAEESRALGPPQKAVSLGVSGSAIAIIGVQGGFGVVWDPKTGVSLYLTYGFSAGLALAAGIGGQIGESRSSETFFGESSGVGVSGGPFSADVSTVPSHPALGVDWNNVTGGSAGFAKSVGLGTYVKRDTTIEVAGHATDPKQRAEKGGIARTASKAQAAAKNAAKEAAEIDRAVARMKPLYELRLDPKLLERQTK